jgi:hypothetical protein
MLKEKNKGRFEMSALMELIIIVSICLIATVVLFKVLKSSASIDSSAKAEYVISIKKSRVIAGGALAGFIILFGLITNFYYYLETEECKNKWKHQPWTITGHIVKENDQLYRGINVNYIPHQPAFRINGADGSFSLYRVMICKSIKWPTLQFSCNGYMPDNYKLTHKNVDVDEDSKIIQLKHKVFLERENL